MARFVSRKKIILPPTTRDFTNNQYPFEEFYKDYYSSVLKAMMKYTDGDEYEAEDLTQDCFEKLLRNYDRMYHIGYFATILNYRIIDYGNGIVNSPECIAADDDNEFFEFENSHELPHMRDLMLKKSFDLVFELIEKEKDKQLFYAYYVEGRDPSEICEIYNIKNGNLHTTLHRVRHYLKEKLARRGYGEEFIYEFDDGSSV